MTRYSYNNIIIILTKVFILEFLSAFCTPRRSASILYF